MTPGYCSRSSLLASPFTPLSRPANAAIPPWILDTSPPSSFGYPHFATTRNSAFSFACYPTLLDQKPPPSHIHPVSSLCSLVFTLFLYPVPIVGRYSFVHAPPRLPPLLSLSLRNLLHVVIFRFTLPQFYHTDLSYPFTFKLSFHLGVCHGRRVQGFSPSKISSRPTYSFLH